MDKFIEEMPKQHQEIYFSAQLKIVNISQALRTFQTKISKNQMQNYMGQQTNVFYLLQKLFKEANFHHVFDLLKNIQLNYNTMIALLQDMNYKLTQKLQSRSRINSSKKLSQNIQSISTGQTNQFYHPQKPLKMNKLGGVMLYNENFSRYIEDSAILDQIRQQKQNRLNKIKRDLLRESVFDDIKEQMSSNQAKPDEVAKYIMQFKNKESFFNYNSSQEELKDILQFFQNTQKEANNFLIKKTKRLTQEDNCFSFANIERDIMYSNSKMKNSILNKFKELMMRYNLRQEEFDQYSRQKQLQIEQLKSKGIKIHKSSQTQLNVNQILNKTQKDMKSLQIKFQTLKCIGRQQAINGQNQYQLKAQIQSKQIQIQNLYHRITQLEHYIQKTKQQHLQIIKRKMNANQANIALKKTKTQQNDAFGQDNKQKIDENSLMDLQQFYKNTRNNSQMTYSNWRNSKISNGTGQFISYNDIASQNFLNGSQFKHEKRKYVKYNMKNAITSQQKKQASNKNLKEQSVSEVKKSFKQISIQTDLLNLKSQPFVQIQNKEITSKQLKSAQRKLLKSTSRSTSRKENRINQNSSPTSKLNHIKQSQKHQQLSKSGHNKIIKILPNQVKIQRSKQNIKQSTNKNVNSPKQSQSKVMKLKQESRISSQIEKLSFSRTQSNEDQALIQYKNTKIKNINNYKIFEVLQDEKQYETQKNSQRSLKHYELGNCIKPQKSQFAQKLNSRLITLELQKYQMQSNLYHVIIYPSKIKQQIINIENIPSNENQLKQENQLFSKANQSLSDVFNSIKISIKSIKLIQSNQQLQIQKQKINQWQLNFENILKGQNLTQRQANAILQILHSCSDEQTQKKYKICQKSSSYYKNVSLNSFQGKHHSNSFEKVDKKISLPQSIDQIIEKKGSSLTYSNNMQKQLGQRLHFQLYHSKILQTFQKTHKNCQEGLLCSHIVKYFENLTKYFEEKKKGCRKSALILHIQNIGQIKDNNNAQKNYKLLKQQNKKKKNRHSSDQISDPMQHYISKQKTIRKKNSNLMLPIIKPFKKIARSSMHNLIG